MSGRISHGPISRPTDFIRIKNYEFNKPSLISKSGSASNGVFGFALFHHEGHEEREGGLRGGRNLDKMDRIYRIHSSAKRCHPVDLVDPLKILGCDLGRSRLPDFFPSRSSCPSW